MKPINTQSLVHIIKTLPLPREKGEVRQAKLPERVTELNEESPPSSFGELSKTASYRVLTFVAVAYARDRHEWLEWELTAQR